MANSTPSLTSLLAAATASLREPKSSSAPRTSSYTFVRSIRPRTPPRALMCRMASMVPLMIFPP